MDEFASDLARRATRLRDGVFELMRAAVSNIESDSDSRNLSLVPMLKERIARLESELRENEGRLEEMPKARNEAVASERRVRRGLYRLASGRMNMEEVLKVSFAAFVCFVI